MGAIATRGATFLLPDASPKSLNEHIESDKLFSSNDEIIDSFPLICAL